MPAPAPYDMLDAWWGDRFGASLGDRLELPIDQSRALFEHVENQTIPRLVGPGSRFSLEPAMSPWGIENHELIFALANARMMADMLNGMNQPGEAYAFIHYDGFYAINPVTETQRGVGPYWVISARDRTADFRKTVHKIASLALLCPRIHLCVDSLLPRPPHDEAPNPSWVSWNQDVNVRLRTLALLRPLAEVDGVAVVRPSVPGESLSKDMINEEFLVRSGESDEILNGYELYLGRMGEPRYDSDGNILALPSHELTGYDEFYRDRTAEFIMLRQVQNTLSWSSESQAQVLTQYSAAQRLIESMMMQGGSPSAPAGSRMRNFATIGMTESVSVGALLGSAYDLRRTGEFGAWRETLSDALQAIDSLGPNDDPSATRAFVLETMRPGIERLRTLAGQPMTLKEAGGSALKGVTIGAAAFGAGVVGGAAPLPAAAAGIVTALGRPFLDFLSSRRKRDSPAWDTYVSLGS